MENVRAKDQMRETELESVCKEQAARIEQLNQLVLRFCLPELCLWLVSTFTDIVHLSPGGEIERREKYELFCV